MAFDEGQYPPPANRPPPKWDAQRNGYGCSIPRGCATWLGARRPTLELAHRAMVNPSAFIAVQCHDSDCVLIWPIDFKAFNR